MAGFTAHGHTGFAERGSDIVCAAVSALTTVTVLGLQARLELDPEVHVDEEEGYLHCMLDKERVPSSTWIRAQDLLETLALGLKEIAKEHSRYVRVKEVAK